MLEKKKETYLCDYQYKGKLCSFRVEAESWEEAREIIKAMGTAECIGILKADIYIPFKPKPLTVRLMTKLAKFFGYKPQRRGL